MLYQLLSISAPVFVCAAIGYMWARMDRPFDTSMVTNLVSTIGVPSLVFSTLVTVNVDLLALSQMAGYTFAAIALMSAGAYGLLKATGMSVRAFLPAMVFPNTGNVGIPLAMLAFGPEGMALAVAYFAVCIVFQFTGGVALSSGAASPQALLRVPTVYAVALAIVFMLMETTPPEWAMNTVKLLGGFAIPLMLITLGISLARLKVESFGRSLFVALTRICMGFLVGLALSELFGLEGFMRGVLILQSSLPVAVFNYLFAQRYDTEPEAVAGSVVLSTVISFASLPLLLWFVL